MTNRQREERQALIQEREEIRQTIVTSLHLIIQSQYVLADLQENQKRLERLLDQLTPKEKRDGDTGQKDVTTGEGSPSN